MLNLLRVSTLLVLSLLLGPICMDVFAGPVTKPLPNHFPEFQVIQDELTLDNTTIKNAAIVIKEGNVYGGLNVELKPEAAKELNEITTAGKGRRMNLVFNNVIITDVVIQEPLNGNFLISEISREDAQAFLNVLNANKPKPKEQE